MFGAQSRDLSISLAHFLKCVKGISSEDTRMVDNHKDSIAFFHIPSAAHREQIPTPQFWHLAWPWSRM